MKQEKALELMKAGWNVFLTGSAGSGKTYCLKKYISYLKEHQIDTAITASTGIASTHLGGKTIHSWSGIQIREEIDNDFLEYLKAKEYLCERMKNVRVLIIDEISMLNKRQFSIVDQVLRFFKKVESAFGGIQVIVCGDFFQLPPVAKGRENSRDLFAFLSESWKDANFQTCYLTEQFRSKDNELDFISNKIRNREVDFEVLKILDAKIEEKTTSIKHPYLYTHKVNVENINAKNLKDLPGEEITYNAAISGNKQKGEQLLKDILAPEELKLKINAEVIFVLNHPYSDYVNGTRGKVIGFNENDLPKVQLLDGTILDVEVAQWDYFDDFGDTIASVRQLPLQLAWALTIHKSQGMTLDEATIDLSRTFEYGQGYVALSRLKSLDSLCLKGYNDKALLVDDLAFKADIVFRQLSDNIDSASTPPYVYTEEPRPGSEEAPLQAYIKEEPEAKTSDLNFSIKLENSAIDLFINDAVDTNLNKKDDYSIEFDQEDCQNDYQKTHNSRTVNEKASKTNMLLNFRLDDSSIKKELQKNNSISEITSQNKSIEYFNDDVIEQIKKMIRLGYSIGKIALTLKMHRCEILKHCIKFLDDTEVDILSLAGDGEDFIVLLSTIIASKNNKINSDNNN